MLTKPLSHLRPLLRLPSHPSPGPEHFSSNPSLLHHLPHNPTASLVSASQSSAQAAGAGSSSGPSGAGSGRAGWGAGTGSGGGYTGHARAFLALQQNAALDPSSGINHSNDEQQRKSNALFFKHGIGRNVQVVQVENETLGRSVHRSIEARSGSRVGIVDLEGKSIDEGKLLEAGDRTASKRRSSITFPSPNSNTTSRAASPIPSRPITPRQSLSRSQSSSDLWHVGVSRPRDVHIRQLSTKSSNIPLPLVEETDTPIVSAAPPLSTRVLGQPNRVLMDLAGIDLPGRPARSPLVRRNSTAAVQRSESVMESSDNADVDASPEATAEHGLTEDDIKDKNIYAAIAEARNNKNAPLLIKLVNYYRSARTADAFNIGSRDDELLAKYPLAPYYSTPCYNACIEGYLAILKVGESIAPILEMYNEMIDRDCLPNGRTYSNLVRALCFRERDIALARRDWEREKVKARWRAEQLGLEYDLQAEEDQNQVFEAYSAEGNLSSALKLFETAISTLYESYRMKPAAYRAILKTAAKVNLTTDQVRSVFNVVRHANATRTNGNRALRGEMFLVYARNGQTNNLRDEWAKFKEHDIQAKYRGYQDWLEEFSQSETSTNELALMKARSQVWLNAAEAFVIAGDIDTAEDIIADLLKASQDQSSMSQDQMGPPSYLPLAAVGEFGKTLIQRNYPEGLQFFLERKDIHNVWARYHHSVIGIVLDAVVQHGSVEDMSAIVLDNKFWDNLSIAERSDLYPAISRAFGTEHDSAAWSVFNWVVYKERVVFNLDMFRHLLQSMLRSDQRSRNLWWALAPFKRSDGQPLDAETQQHLLETLKSVFREVELRLGCQLKLLERAAQFTDVSNEEFSIIVAKTYLAHGAADLNGIASVEPREELIMTLLNLSADEGEYDEAFVRVAADLAKMVQENPMALKRREEGLPMKALAARMVHRLGQERTTELLTPVFGEAWVGKWVQAPSPASSSLPSGAETAEQSPSGLPAAPSTTVDSRVGKRQLQISPQLSSYLSRVNRPYSQQPIAMRDALKAIRVELESSGTVAHPSSLAHLIDILSRENQEKETRRLYSLAQHIIFTVIPDAEKRADWLQIENAMLIACCHLGHLEEAGMHRARILNAGMVPSADAYATMIACSKDTTDDALVARELFDEARSMGVEPNLFLYNTIISKLSKARKAEMALELFKVMKASGLRPSSVTYGAVINACCRVGDGESAAVLFQEMSSRPDFKPRVPPYNTMMQFHLTTQPSRERVLYYYNELLNHNVPLSAHTYKLLLDAYGALPEINLPAMEKVFDDLIYDRKVQVQGTHWASLITAYGIHGNDLDKAMELFRSIPAAGRAASVNVKAEPVIWEAVISVLTHHNEIEEMEKIMNEMLELNVRATAYVYNNLILGYARGGMLDKARGVFNSMGDSITGVAAPNNHPQLLTSSGHLKPSTVTNAPTGVVYREPSTYETMIRAELSAGNVEAAQEVLERMKERRYPFAVFMRAKVLLDDYTDSQPATQGPEALEAATISPSFVPVSPPVVQPSETLEYMPSSPVKKNVLDEILSEEEKSNVRAEKEKTTSQASIPDETTSASASENGSSGNETTTTSTGSSA